MFFKDRANAGKLLTPLFRKYRNQEVVVYALPRGGIVPAVEIAEYLNAPLDLIITRKIGHPYSPEYAIGAIAENGHSVFNKSEIVSINKVYLNEESKKQQDEAKRRRKVYMADRPQIPSKGKIAIVVDDGIATGLTMKAAIAELQIHFNPKEIIVAVPVAPSDTVEELEKAGAKVIAINKDTDFLGAIGSYYQDFSAIEDEEVIAIIKAYDKKRQEAELKKLAHFAAQPAVDPTLFAFPPYRYMVKNLKKIPNFTIGEFTVDRYPNHELHVMLNSHATERECIVIGSISPPEKNMVSFLLLCHTLKKENAYRITALLPYLAYSRHDKKLYQRSYGAALIGGLLQASGIDEVVTMDVHSPNVKKLFPIPLISISPAKTFAHELAKLYSHDTTIVAPDEGARRRAEDVAREAGIKKKIAYVVKKRTADGVELIELHGNVGKKVVIVDDILDTGKTLILCCEKLIEKGVLEIIIMVTHGLFTGNEWERLWKLRVKRIYCTDSVPLPKKITSEKITVLSITPLLVEELREENKGTFITVAGKQSSFYDYDEP